MGVPKWSESTQANAVLKAAIEATYTNWLATSGEGGGLMGEERFSYEPAWRKILKDKLPQMAEDTMAYMRGKYGHCLLDALDQTAYWAAEKKGSENDVIRET